MGGIPESRKAAGILNTTLPVPRIYPYLSCPEIPFPYGSFCLRPLRPRLPARGLRCTRAGEEVNPMAYILIITFYLVLGFLTLAGATEP